MPDRLDTFSAKGEMVQRLRCIEGHVRGIAGMIESEADGRAILLQIAAAQSALRAVNQRLIRHYLDDCLRLHVVAPDAASRERTLAKVVALYKSLGGRPL